MEVQRTDQMLVIEAQNGNKKAFNLLVARYQNKVAGLLSRYVSANDIQDVAQETFIKAYRSLDSFRGDSAFYTWLYRIAVNTAKNYLTAQNRRPPSEDILAEDAENYNLGSLLRDIETPESLVISTELNNIVFTTIDNLPEELKTAIMLREIDGMSYDEIAATMGCPVGTVRSRIFRAREILEQKIHSFIE